MLLVLENGLSENCLKLKNVTLPNTLTSLEETVFGGCPDLATINLPNTLTNIGVCAFQNCTSLKDIIIPSIVTYIGDWAFSGCNSINTINVPQSVLSIGNNAFSQTATAKITLPSKFKDDYQRIGLLVGQVELTAVSLSDLNNWLSQKQTEGINTVLNSPNNYNLYTTSQIQNMAMGGMVLTKQVNGQFVLNYDIQQSTDLQNWTTYQAYALPLTGLPTDKAFVRVKMINSNPNPPPSTAAGSNMN